MLTTCGTPTLRAATRPYQPGFGLWVCTMSGRSERSTRRSSTNAATSRCGAIDRVAWRSGTWRMPAASSSPT